MSLLPSRKSGLRLTAVWLIALIPGACSPGAPTHDAPATGVSKQDSVTAPVVEMIAPEPGGLAKSIAPSLDYACGVDADCEVKDVGNCCGRLPACVNRAARPDPAAVQRECGRTGSASICGFQELSGCRCEARRCVGVPSASGGGGEVR